MVIRRATAADLVWVASLEATAVGMAVPPDLSSLLFNPDVLMTVNDGRGAYCRLSFLDVGAGHGYPFPAGASTQVAMLLPFEAGLFTDGTMPALLGYSLREMVSARPEAVALPVWANLDLVTLDKYQRLMVALTRALPMSRRVNVSGRTIWMRRLSDAAAVLP